MGSICSFFKQQISKNGNPDKESSQHHRLLNREPNVAKPSINRCYNGRSESYDGEVLSDSPRSTIIKRMIQEYPDQLQTLLYPSPEEDEGKEASPPDLPDDVAKISPPANIRLDIQEGEFL